MIPRKIKFEASDRLNVFILGTATCSQENLIPRAFFLVVMIVVDSSLSLSLLSVVVVVAVAAVAATLAAAVYMCSALFFVLFVPIFSSLHDVLLPSPDD